MSLEVAYTVVVTVTYLLVLLVGDERQTVDDLLRSVLHIAIVWLLPLLNLAQSADRHTALSKPNGLTRNRSLTSDRST